MGSNEVFRLVNVKIFYLFQCVTSFMNSQLLVIYFYAIKLLIWQIFIVSLEDQCFHGWAMLDCHVIYVYLWSYLYFKLQVKSY